MEPDKYYLCGEEIKVFSDFDKIYKNHRDILKDSIYVSFTSGSTEIVKLRLFEAKGRKWFNIFSVRQIDSENFFKIMQVYKRVEQFVSYYNLKPAVD